jgi:hypothetical protein
LTKSAFAKNTQKHWKNRTQNNFGWVAERLKAPVLKAKIGKKETQENPGKHWVLCQKVVIVAFLFTPVCDH